jgi:uncharacterized protein (TIGR00299 family) protein
MKTLYLDIFSGISGDMFLGAMLDLGVDLGELERELDKLGVTGYHLHATRKQNSNIAGIKFDVHLEEHHLPGPTPTPTPTRNHNHTHDHDHEHEHEHEHKHEHDHEHSHDHGHSHHETHEHTALAAGSHSHSDARDFADIRELIQRSALSEWVKGKAVSVFRRVAVAEGKIHGHPPEHVHFHEVGALDSIIDIVGACIALERLGRPRVLAAPVVEGTGWVECAHGRFPVPTTATLEILGARGVALTQTDEPHELVTPTGAALLAEFVESFTPMCGLTANRIGYGLGTRVNKTRPNVLRAILSQVTPSGSPAAGSRDWETDTVAVLETNIDDCNPEILGYFVERALKAEALDVFHTPIQMKKNRPGVLLTVLCPASEADAFTEMLLKETSAFGIRRYLAERRKLRREAATVPTPYGEVAVKLGRLNGRVLHATPEFESCKKVAESANAPLHAVYVAAEQAALKLRQT